MVIASVVTAATVLGYSLLLLVVIAVSFQCCMMICSTYTVVKHFNIPKQLQLSFEKVYGCFREGELRQKKNMRL